MATLFSPDGVYWRVNREAVLLLGGGRALLMQIAHPLVAAAVADHSDFINDPVGRLRRTVAMMLTIVFGSAEDARAACARLEAVHRAVKGRLAAPAGGFPAGTPYDARDPDLLFWVHATLVDTAMLVYQRYVRELSAGARGQYYQESKTVAQLLGIPAAAIPGELADFETYMDWMIERGPVSVSATARTLSASVLRPSLSAAPGLTFDPLNVVTIGLLPAKLRQEFGLAWGSARQFLFDASSTAIRTMIALLPDPLRAMPAARLVERKAAQRAGAPAHG